MNKNKLMILVCVFAVLAPWCHASDNNARLQELAQAGNINRTTAPLLAATEPNWQTQAYNYLTSPHFFSKLGDSCLASAITTAGIAGKLSSDRDSNSCPNDEAIYILKISTICVAGVAVLAHSTSAYLKHRRNVGNRL